MGFDESRCVASLKVKSDRNEALEWLLAQDAAAEQQKHAPQPKPTVAAVRKPNVAAVKPAAPASAASRPSAHSYGASSVVAPLQSLNLNEQKALEQREAKRVELLKLLEQEAAEKAAKARAKATKTTPVTTKTTVAAAKKSAPASSASAIPAAAAAAATARDDPLTPSEHKLAQIAADRAVEVARVRMAALRVQKRLSAERQLTDIATVCRALRSNYDALRYDGILHMLRRIVDKVVADDGRTEKFRRIALANPKLELTLVRPIGAIWILKQAGFEETIVDNADRMTDVDADAFVPREEERVLVLPTKKVDLNRLRQVSHTLTQQSAMQASQVPAIFDEIIASHAYSTEAVYHLALELRLIVQNIIISTDEIDDVRHADADSAAAASATAMSDVTAASSSSSSRRTAVGVNANFRTIDKHESSYVNRIKPIRESKRILALLGFVLDEHDSNRQFLTVPFDQLVSDGVKRYQVILRDLNAIVVRVRCSTPIALGVRTFAASNRRQPASKFVSILLDAIRLVVADPHEQKYHKIVLDKVQSKIGNDAKHVVHGMTEMAQLIGFQPVQRTSTEAETSAAGDIDTRRVALKYPGFDEDQLKMRLDELETNWAATLEQAASESGGIASSWSFE